MALPQFEYLAPRTLEEASNLYAELGAKSRVIAGGTDTIPPIRDGVFKPDYLIDLKRIQGLDYLDYDEKEGLKIGCLTKLFDIQTSKLVREKNPSIAQAAKYIASTQVRHVGTMVGNICNSSPSCDTGPILIAQNANVLAHSIEEDRVIHAGEFFTGVKKNALKAGEIVTGIVIPPLGKNEHAAYIKHSVRKAMDLAIVGVAAWLKMDDKKCADARIVMGAVSITPVRSPSAERELIGKELTDEVINRAGVAAMDDCKPISDVRASADYRHEMIRVFTKRVIKKALEGYEGDHI